MLEFTSSRRRGIGHGPRRSIGADDRSGLLPNLFFSIADFSLILHYHAAAAAKPFNTVIPKTPFKLILSADRVSLECGKNPYGS